MQVDFLYGSSVEGANDLNNRRLGRRRKKSHTSLNQAYASPNQETTPSPSTPTSSPRFAPFNFLVERARGLSSGGGAGGSSGAKERTRTRIPSGASVASTALSSSPTGSNYGGGFLGRESSNHGTIREDGPEQPAQRKPSMTSSSSIQSFALFFRRTPTTSTGAASFASAKTESTLPAKESRFGRRGKGLMTSPSSPDLSTLINGGEGEGDGRWTQGQAKARGDRAVYLEGGRPQASASTGDLLSSSSEPATNLARSFSRSFDDLDRVASSSPIPPNNAPSLLSPTRKFEALPLSNPDPQPRRGSEDVLSSPLRKLGKNPNRASLSPSAALSLLSATAPPTSPRKMNRVNAPTLPGIAAPGSSPAASTSYPNPPTFFNKRSKSPPRTNNPSSVPFPTSASTPDFQFPSFPPPLNIGLNSKSSHSPLFTASSSLNEHDYEPSPLINSGNRKRDSQTIVHLGLLQRKIDYSPQVSATSLNFPQFPGKKTSEPPSLDLSKGWKPYGAALRGSKLYLYKLPSELITAAKSVFPVTVVREDEVEFGIPTGLGLSDSVPGGFGGPLAARKKQRAFWGTGSVSHPALILEDRDVDGEKEGAGKTAKWVRGGTVEALMHELVFATTASLRKGEGALFATSIMEAEALLTPFSTLEETPYDHFVETLLLYWPFFPFSADESANEFDRLVDLAIRTARETLNREPETAKVSTPKLIARLDHLIELVCERYPEDMVNLRTGAESDWKVVLEKTVKELETIRVIREGGGPDQRDGDALVTQAYESSRDKVGVGFTEWTGDASTTLGGGPGRPIRTGLTKSTSSTSIASTPGASKRRGSQESDLGTPATLQPQQFLNLDPIAFASQIHLFHLDRLAAIAHNRPARHILRAATILVSLSLDPNSRLTAITPLFSFSSSKPHFLTRALLDTILVPLRSSPGTIAPSSFSNSSSAALQLRVAVLTRWIVVAEELRRSGDACGWVAVATGVCSRAVARLEDTWRLVPADLVQVVRLEWVPILARAGYSELERNLQPVSFEGSQEGMNVPFLGSILEDSMVALKLASTPIGEDAGAVDLQPLYELREKFTRVEEVWVSKPSSLGGKVVDKELQFFLQTISRMTPHSQVVPLNSYLVLSLEVEPRLPIHHLNIPSRSTVNPLVPLVFVEPLPHINLGQQEMILGSITGQAISHKQSNSSLSNAALAEFQQRVPLPPALATRLGRHNSYPPSAATTSSEKIGIFSRLRQEIANSSDTLLRFADGDIVFRIISSALPSMRTGAFPSERNGGGLLSRNSSWMESKSTRRSMKSKRTSTYSTAEDLLRISWTPSGKEESPSSSKLMIARDEEPIYVVVKEGTVESLVDLLVLGTDNLRAPSTDADGESSLTQRRPLYLDMDEYRSTFFATYKSFMPPLVLMDLLRKRYLAAPNASREKVTLSSSKPFPSWSLAPIAVQSEDSVDWDSANRIRSTILEDLQYWIANHVGDFLDDEDLFIAAGAFLLLVEATEKEVCEERVDHDDRVLTLAGTLKRRFKKEVLRPAVRSRKFPSSSIDGSDFSFDAVPINELVDRLDAVACEAFREVTERDLLVYLQVLEASTLSNPSLWYSSKYLHRVDDEEVVITDMYCLLSTIAADSTSPLRPFPPSIQNVINVHSVVRRWVLGHLVDPSITLAQRQCRINRALDVVEICRSRMANVFFGDSPERQSTLHGPSLASLVERAVTSALVAPESRLFASVWSATALARFGKSTPEHLASIIRSEPLLTDKTATLDLAWVFERLLEIVLQVNTSTSINFDKGRWVANCIRNAVEIKPSQLDYSRKTLQEMERKIGAWGHWGIRILRDVASGEGNKYTKSIKPFHRLVAQQQEKVRRERQARDFISKSQKMEQLGRLQREKDLAKAMERATTVRNNRMTALFQKVRPLPTVPGTPTNSTTPASPGALQALKAWLPNTKPYLVLALSQVQVKPLDNTQRSFVFELTTEDGQKLLFQARSHDDFRNWVTNFQQTGSLVHARRETLLARTALVEQEEEPSSLSSNRGQGKTAVFGVPLADLLRREGGTLPKFFDFALKGIEQRGLHEMGIYRISGENKVINDTKAALDRAVDPVRLLTDMDVHNLSGLVKLFLRDLPEPLIPFDFYDRVIEINKIPDYDQRLYGIRELIWTMPAPNFHVLRRLCEHLDLVTEEEQTNAMHAANLAIIFAPTLLKPPPGKDSFGLSMANLGTSASIIKSLILSAHWLFGEEVVEEEVEQLEEEGEEEILAIRLPVAEEDEEEDEDEDEEEEQAINTAEDLVDPGSDNAT